MKQEKNNEQLVSIDGWLTKDSNGFVTFHDSVPYVVKTAVNRIGNTTLPKHEERSCWYSNMRFMTLGRSEELGVDIDVAIPQEVVLKVFSK